MFSSSYCLELHVRDHLQTRLAEAARARLLAGVPAVCEACAVGRRLLSALLRLPRRWVGAA